MNKIYTLFIMGFCFLSASIAHAQNSAPVEISANNTLEWLQNEKQYVANGAVEAKQGDVTILAEKLTADYKDDKNGGNTNIWQLTAEENVILKNTDSTATGDKAVYNVETGLAILTGGNLKLTTPDQIITATDRMEYNTISGTAKALGNAKITQNKDTISAKTITAHFTKDKAGNQILTTANADGGVTIQTPDETLTGDNGIYNATNNTATVTGKVKIIRGANQLEGAKAEVNLTTNISKMFGAPESGKRVKGIFFPGSEKPQEVGEK